MSTLRRTIVTSSYVRIGVVSVQRNLHKRLKCDLLAACGVNGVNAGRWMVGGGRWADGWEHHDWSRPRKPPFQETEFQWCHPRATLLPVEALVFHSSCYRAQVLYLVPWYPPLLRFLRFVRDVCHHLCCCHCLSTVQCWRCVERDGLQFPPFSRVHHSFVST